MERKLLGICPGNPIMNLEECEEGYREGVSGVIYSYIVDK